MLASTARAALDDVFAAREVESVLERLVSAACEAAWQDRYVSLANCVGAAQGHIAALELEREADRIAKLNSAIEAEEVKMKFELELWEVARQLQERKRFVRVMLPCRSPARPVVPGCLPYCRVESELLASRMREDELLKQVEAAKSALLSSEISLSRYKSGQAGRALFTHLKSGVYIVISTFLEVRSPVARARSGFGPDSRALFRSLAICTPGLVPVTACPPVSPASYVAS